MVFCRFGFDVCKEKDVLLMAHVNLVFLIKKVNLKEFNWSFSLSFMTFVGTLLFNCFIGSAVRLSLLG